MFQDVTVADFARDHLVLTGVVLLVVLRIGAHSARFALKLFAQFLAFVSEEIAALTEAVETLVVAIRVLRDRLASLRLAIFGGGRAAQIAFGIVLIGCIAAAYGFGLKTGRDEIGHEDTRSLHALRGSVSVNAAQRNTLTTEHKSDPTADESRESHSSGIQADARVRSVPKTESEPAPTHGVSVPGEAEN